jgi:transcriptional repressor of dcmA and dcmR
MSESEELLDIEQAARFLNVSETSLRRWTNAGRLACLRVGRRRERRFRRADLLAFMEPQPAGARAEGSAHLPHNSGRTVVDGIPVKHGTHLCGLYDSDEGRANQAAAFLAGGLRAGLVNYLVSLADAREQVMTALERSHPRVRLDVEAGRLVLAEYTDSPEEQWAWWERRMSEALRLGVTLLRCVGDVWGLARKISVDDLLRYETGYDVRIAQRFPVVTLCQYDTRRFSGSAVLQALKAHRDTFLYPPERVLA